MRRKRTCDVCGATKLIIKFQKLPKPYSQDVDKQYNTTCKICVKRISTQERRENARIKRKAYKVKRRRVKKTQEVRILKGSGVIIKTEPAIKKMWDFKRCCAVEVKV